MRPLSSSGVSQQVVERGAIPDAENISSAAPLVDAIHIDVRERVVEWVEWVGGVVLRAEQALLQQSPRETESIAWEAPAVWYRPRYLEERRCA
jgi:hypothetical protein